MECSNLHRTIIEETVRALAPAGSKIVSIREIRTARAPSIEARDGVRVWPFTGRWMHHQTHCAGKDKL